MKHLIVLSIVFFILSSCSKVLYDINYQGEDNYKSFYIVDTIDIDNPIRVYSEKFGGMFVLSSEKLKEYRNDIEFFLAPDVFILGNDLYRDLSLSDYKNFTYPDFGGCELQISENKIEGIEIYEFTNQPKFILGLINTNYYFLKHNSQDFFNIPLKNSKITYHKIVYPICE